MHVIGSLPLLLIAVGDADRVQPLIDLIEMLWVFAICELHQLVHVPVGVYIEVVLVEFQIYKQTYTTA